MRGDPDQRAAIVIGNNLDPGRQASVAVELFDLGLHARDDVVGMLGPPHHHDRGGNVVVVVPAPDSQPRHITDGNIGYLLDLDRKTVRLAQDDILDVLNLVTLGDIVGAAAVDQADTADIDRLLADGDLAAADIDVGVAERGDQLRDRDVIGFELLQVGVDIELLGGSAPGIDLHDSGNREETTRDHVILHRAQIGQSEMRRTDELVAVDFPDKTGLLNLGNLIARQVDVLLQADRRLREREVKINPVFEGDADERQSIEGSRANIDDAGGGIKAHLHRDR